MLHIVEWQAQFNTILLIPLLCAVLNFYDTTATTILLILLLQYYIQQYVVLL